MKITESSAELIGAVMGDGHIYRKNCKYRIGFTGNIETDKEYYEYLKKLILKEWNKEIEIKVASGGLRIVVHSKDICNFLIDEIGLPYGEGKCERIFIPEFIASDWRLVRNTIRALFDTDGTVFVAKKPRVEKYPSIELTTTSKVIAHQVKEILEKANFRVAKIWQFTSKKGRRIVYRVPLNGQKNLRKWIKEIGFSNPWKLNKAISYLK